MAVRLPDPVRSGAEAAWARRLGRAAGIASAESVGGGCISPTARVETEGGDVAFLKWGAPGDAGPDMLPEEARSLRALADAGAVRVPAVLGVSSPGEDAVPWLLLEWLEPGRRSRGTMERLGRELARLHRTRADHYGWPADNYIGSLPQDNEESDDWAAFWRERRLAPQLRRAYDGGFFDERARRRFDGLLDRLDEWLAGAEADGASLLHGDLWSGNVHVLADGAPALIDPASYHGHREVDLAMSELFGGFPPAFYDAYEEAWPLQPGYPELRRPVYQLYYLLVHVNLFGESYVAGTLARLDEIGV